jgi:hypothetical protein
MGQNEQISITLAFKKDDAALISVTKQVQGFLDTLSKGVDLGIGVNLANGLLAIPGQFRAAISASVEYASTVRNMALETRTTASAMQVLMLLASETGASITALTAAEQHMSLAAEQATDGNAKMADAFRRLGINAQEFTGLSVPDQLQEVADAAKKAGWDTQSMNDIAEVLGKRTAPQLMGALRALADQGFRGVSQAAIEAGAVLSDQVTADVAKLGDEWKTTGQIWKTTGAMFAEYLKPLLDVIATISDKIALLIQRTILGAHLLAADLKAVWDTIPQFFHSQMDGSLAQQLAKNVEIAGALVNAKFTPVVTKQTQTAVSPQESSAKIKKDADEVARLSIELEKLKHEAEEAAMSASERAADLAKRVTEANTAILAYSKSHAGDLSKDPAFLKLEITREQLEKEYELAQKTAERAAKEEQAATARAAKAAAEKADKDQIAISLAAEIPLRERLADIEKERSLITQNHLLDNITKQARLNDNAEAYRKIVEQIVALEKLRYATAKDPLEVARLKAEIARLQTGAREYGRREEQPTKEQSSAAAFGKLGDPTQHFQSPQGGLIAGLQDFATGMGTVADQIHGHVMSIANGLTSGIGNALHGLETRTMSWGNAFRSVANGLAGSLLQAGNQMVANWIVTESAKTLISAGGAEARTAIAGEETVFTLIHAAIRFAAHAASEAGKTAVTLLQTPIRIASIVAESMANIVSAATGALSAMSSIPYVGPFLAIGAMAAIIAAGVGLVKSVGKGFRTGGYTGDGPEDGVAGNVHYREGVIHAPAMRGPGMFEALAAINAGDRLRAIAALGAGAVGSLSRRAGGLASAKSSADSGKALGIFVGDDRQNIARQMRGSQGKKSIIDTVRDSRGQFFV